MYKKSDKYKIVLNIINNYSKTDDFDLLFKKSLKPVCGETINIKRAQAFLSLYNLKDVILYFNNLIFNELRKQSKVILKNKKTTESIYILVVTRLSILNKFKSFSLRSKNYLLKAQNIFFSKKLLFEISDQIWFLAGDKSLDMNFYSKRIILMKVYFLTFNFWLKDNSKDFLKTKDYLSRQLQFVSKFGKYKFKLKQYLMKLKPKF